MVIRSDILLNLLYGIAQRCEQHGTTVTNIITSSRVKLQICFVCNTFTKIVFVCHVSRKYEQYQSSGILLCFYPK